MADQVKVTTSSSNEDTTNSSTSCRMRTITIYLVRHAEATHNIREREAVAKARGDGCSSKEDLERARRSVLNDAALKDAPLSPDGTSMVRSKSDGLLQLSGSLPKEYPYPEVVFVSPLRRAIETATALWYHIEPRPKFIALEVLREKRTGFYADERSSVDKLVKQFPHVDFTDLVKETIIVPKGENNFGVRERGRIFLEQTLSDVQENTIAVVTHKGWLREFRHVLKVLVDDGSLQIDIDVDNWDQTLFGNAEIRIAQFSWEGTALKSIVSRSVDNIIGSTIHAVESAVETTVQAVQDVMVKLTQRFGDASVSESAKESAPQEVPTSCEQPVM
jgi:broad specificity phosphatase PhoE